MRLPALPALSAALLPLLGLIVSAPVLAQRPGAPGWGVDWGAEYCILARKTVGEAPLTYGLRVMPGRERIELLLVGHPSRVPDFADGRPATVVVEPGGKSLEANVLDSANGAAERTAKFFLSGYSFIGELAQAREVRIEGAIFRSRCRCPRPRRPSRPFASAWTRWPQNGAWI